MNIHFSQYCSGAFIVIVLGHPPPTLSNHATPTLSEFVQPPQSMMLRKKILENPGYVAIEGLGIEYDGTPPPRAEDTSQGEELAQPIRRFGNRMMDAMSRGVSTKTQTTPFPSEPGLFAPLRRFGQSANHSTEGANDESPPEIKFSPEVVNSKGEMAPGDIKIVIDEQNTEVRTGSHVKTPESKTPSVPGNANMQRIDHKPSPYDAEGNIVIDKVASTYRRRTPEAPAPLEDQLKVPKDIDSTRAALTGTRGSGRVAQPWIFSVMMLTILAVFIFVACVFFKTSYIPPTEELIKEFLDKCKSVSVAQLMEEFGPECKTPVPLLVARRLVKRAVDEQNDMLINHRNFLYNEIRKHLLEEHAAASKGKNKEERAELDDGIRRQLLEEKEKIRASVKRDWAAGVIRDPVPSLRECETWCAKLENYWQQRQMASM